MVETSCLSRIRKHQGRRERNPADLETSNNGVSETLLSYSGNALVGIYVGHGVQHADVATNAVQTFLEHIRS